MNTHALKPQRGITTLMVLIMLTVMLMGGLALARLTETSVLSAGNATGKDASLHASEIGWNTAFSAVKALTNDDLNAGTWYWSTMQAVDSHGIPVLAWDNTPEVAVGRYRVHYAVERMCNITPVTMASRQCLVKLTDVMEDRRSDAMEYAPKTARQFRITVRISDARGTQTWVQSLVTKGS